MARDLGPIVRFCLRSNRVNWWIVIVSRLESRDGGSFVSFSISDNGLNKICHVVAEQCALAAKFVLQSECSSSAWFAMTCITEPVPNRRIYRARGCHSTTSSFGRRCRKSWLFLICICLVKKKKKTRGPILKQKLVSSFPFTYVIVFYPSVERDVQDRKFRKNLQATLTWCHLLSNISLTKITEIRN